MYLNVIPSWFTALSSMGGGFKPQASIRPVSSDLESAELEDYYQTAHQLGLSHHKAQEILEQTLRKARRSGELSMSDVIFRAFCTIHLHTYH
ncbi:hypothetical protein B0H98_10750 [Vreelandella songnenensis]|uniref:Uncharacterized protein n=1 Tax=Vreelandella songnenensis TaxID=1176243 RepID=A0A2T0V1C6_9GAMM|nr:hypothetical protein [Halomonas songnenensis]PRY63907.1 hypothetical protein B0H98_10750 [Halomonas songnenensis]